MTTLTYTMPAGGGESFSRGLDERLTDLATYAGGIDHLEISATAAEALSEIIELRQDLAQLMRHATGIDAHEPGVQPMKPKPYFRDVYGEGVSNRYNAVLYELVAGGQISPTFWETTEGLAEAAKRVETELARYSDTEHLAQRTAGSSARILSAVTAWAYVATGKISAVPRSLP